jgi:type IV pilus assembly protein PilY1
MLGSGDREKPLLSATQDHFFQVFDRRKNKGAPELAVPITFSALAPMTDRPSVAGAGCYMTLAQGEKVVNASTSIGGQSFFGTNRPGASVAGPVCTPNLGIAKSYGMRLFCQAATGSTLVGGGLPPSPVAGLVSITDAKGKKSQVPFVIGAPNARASAVEGTRLTPVVEAPRRRLYWFQEVQR